MHKGKRRFQPLYQPQSINHDLPLLISAGRAEEVANNSSQEGWRDWSSLTGLPLLTIASRLDSMEDFFNFRRVCRAWRSIIDPTPETLAFQPPLVLCSRHGSSIDAFFDIARCRLYKAPHSWTQTTGRPLFYSHGFIVTGGETNHEIAHRKITLSNIFTGSQIRLPDTPSYFFRVILSSPPTSAGCLVVSFWHGSNCSIQFCRLGDSSWKVFFLNSGNVIYDMLFFQGNLYALTGRDQLAVVELSPDPKLTIIGPDLAKEEQRWTATGSLADSDGNIMLVSFNMEREVLILHRWDFSERKWIGTSDLGGMALFVGSSIGFASFVKPTGLGVQANCVYNVSNGVCSSYEFSDGRLKKLSSFAASALPIRGCIFLPLWVFPCLC